MKASLFEDSLLRCDDWWIWVIDFGVLAYWESPPPDFAKVGAWVTGEVLISIDPFFYKDYVYQLPKMPDLFNEWVVGRIELNALRRFASKAN
ncbi:hypothetical protein ABH945_004509 [Paraburkholderia sp. GAS333]|uniref:hypothetical protein n=1 Tax=Paraburkholderia sp. GAS333 TaxID=3156279 RepID=UPI003D1D3718